MSSCFIGLSLFLTLIGSVLLWVSHFNKRENEKKKRAPKHLHPHSWDEGY